MKDCFNKHMKQPNKACEYKYKIYLMARQRSSSDLHLFPSNIVLNAFEEMIAPTVKYMSPSQILSCCSRNSHSILDNIKESSS